MTTCSLLVGFAIQKGFGWLVGFWYGFGLVGFV